MKVDKEQLMRSGLIEQYVLGLTDEAESNLVEEAAASDPEIQAIIDELQSGMKDYATQCGVPSASRKSLLAKSHKDYWKPLGIAASSLLIISIGINFWQTMQWRQVCDTNTELEERHEALQLQHDLQQEYYDRLKHAHTHRARLTHPSEQTECLAVVYYNPDMKSAWLNLHRLPQPPRGHQYQVWAEVNGRHVNMGLVRPDSGHCGLFNLQLPVGTDGCVVTLEKEGGSDCPDVDHIAAVGKF